jgi:hypothetical protein
MPDARTRADVGAAVEPWVPASTRARRGRHARGDHGARAGAGAGTGAGRLRVRLPPQVSRADTVKHDGRPPRIMEEEAPRGKADVAFFRLQASGLRLHRRRAAGTGGEGWARVGAGRCLIGFIFRARQVLAARLDRPEA